ncbi:hypothetical protein NPIL_269401, partial [Nephila pilipes]
MGSALTFYGINPEPQPQKPFEPDEALVSLSQILNAWNERQKSCRSATERSTT